MKEGCEAFLSGWEEEIVKVLVNRVDNETPVQQLCYQISKACENVDPANVKPFDDTIMVDGQPQKIVYLTFLNNL
jgi:MinD-like ATPase involved in chromosome partitioning or flagellar assembly